MPDELLLFFLLLLFLFLAAASSFDAFSPCPAADSSFIVFPLHFSRQMLFNIFFFSTLPPRIIVYFFSSSFLFPFINIKLRHRMTQLIFSSFFTAFCSDDESYFLQDEYICLPFLLTTYGDGYYCLPFCLFRLHAAWQRFSLIFHIIMRFDDEFSILRIHENIYNRDRTNSLSSSRRHAFHSSVELFPFSPFFFRREYSIFIIFHSSFFLLQDYFRRYFILSRALFSSVVSFFFSFSPIHIFSSLLPLSLFQPRFSFRLSSFLRQTNNNIWSIEWHTSMPACLFAIRGHVFFFAGQHWQNISRLAAFFREATVFIIRRHLFSHSFLLPLFITLPPSRVWHIMFTARLIASTFADKQKSELPLLLPSQRRTILIIVFLSFSLRCLPFSSFSESILVIGIALARRIVARTHRKLLPARFVFPSSPPSAATLRFCHTR